MTSSTSSLTDSLTYTTTSEVGNNSSVAKVPMNGVTFFIIFNIKRRRRNVTQKQLAINLDIEFLKTTIQKKTQFNKY